MSPTNDGGSLVSEARRTNPDFVVYVPSAYDGTGNDGINEHFLVFDVPAGPLMAVWTQSPPATGLPGGRQKNHIVVARSTDDGETWTPPERVVGPDAVDSDEPMASWAFPLVSASGRIYLLYNRHTGATGWITMHTGVMEGVYSDDMGVCWSAPQRIDLPKSSFDDPSGETPGEWIVWQRPERDLSGGYYVGYSHWLHPSVAALGREEVRGWTWIESVVEFMRFTNVDDDPQPRDLEIAPAGWGDRALRVPHYIHPHVSVAQEPSLVRLPDKRLFCVMRTCSGYIWWSDSSDDGATWANPRPLLDHDHGSPLLNPVGCDPIYRMSDGRYLLLHHNHRGFLDGGPGCEARPRRPVFLRLGEYRRDGDQPVWFSEPKLLMDTEGFWVDGKRYDEGDCPGNNTLSMYSSFTAVGGRDVLWYPDRKFFLLGKVISPDLLEDLFVPEAI